VPVITHLLVFSHFPSLFYSRGFKFLFCYAVGTYFCTFHHFFYFISCACYRLASIMCIMGFEKGNIYFWVLLHCWCLPLLLWCNFCTYDSFSCIFYTCHCLASIVWVLKRRLIIFFCFATLLVAYHCSFVQVYFKL
jgi:hypothetical protein